MELTLNGIVIESRASDKFVNATQLCKAGGKFFKDWHKLHSTKVLIEELEKSLEGTIVLSRNTVIDIIKGRYNQQGSWVHPDLAVQLAQWISPSFAIQVSRWIRELFLVGSVSIDSRKSDEELKELQDKVCRLERVNREKDEAVKCLERVNKEKDETLNRLHNIHKDLLSFKKRVTKSEKIYIVSTASYARQGIFKIGRTKADMKIRSSGHNVTHVAGDKVKVIKEIAVHDAILVERNVHTKLRGLLLDGEKEFFMCPYDLLESVIDLIINNDEVENESINRIIDTVYKIKQHAFDAVEWVSGIPENFFQEVLTISSGDEKLGEIDVTLWPEYKKREFAAFCIKEYIKLEHGADEEQFQVMWKVFQTFMVSQLSIPKYKFKASLWKDVVKDEVEKMGRLSIKWRA